MEQFAYSIEIQKYRGIQRRNKNFQSVSKYRDEIEATHCERYMRNLLNLDLRHLETDKKSIFQAR